MNIGSYYEFFAGGGMARAGLGPNWNCLFANDFDRMKARSYQANWAGNELVVEDVNLLSTSQLPGVADLAWASFPCQDLSLAGNSLGLGTEREQTRSGAFWAFWRLMQELAEEGRAPRAIVLENVYGSLTANGGRDFASIIRALSLGGYRSAGLLIDAERFVPQSRPRVFVVALRQDVELPEAMVREQPDKIWHPAAMTSAVARLSEFDAQNWVWLSPPDLRERRLVLADILESEPGDVAWHDVDQTQKIVDMMGAASLTRLEAMRASSERQVGSIYRRTRIENDKRVQRAELRNDGIAGCLRTPGGGSSRQLIIETFGQRIRTRLLSGREAARLMGLPDSYRLPPRYNDAYHVAGDGLAVPVVRFLARELLEPVLFRTTVSEVSAVS